MELRHLADRTQRLGCYLYLFTLPNASNQSVAELKGPAVNQPTACAGSEVRERKVANGAGDPQTIRAGQIR